MIKKLKLVLSLVLVFFVFISSLITASARIVELSDISRKIDDIAVISDKGDTLAMSGVETGDTVLISSDSLPEKYSARDEGYITEIEDQQYSPLCWSFSSITTLETFLNKNNKYKYPFSNFHMPYILRGKEDSHWVGDEWLNEGGRPEMALGYFSSWHGARKEGTDNCVKTDETFFDYDAGKFRREYVKGEATEIMQNFDNETIAETLPDSIIYLDTNNKGSIKSAVKDYGAVSTSLCVAEVYYDNSLTNYFAPSIEAAEAEDGGGHAIAIIGWDNSYSKENFTGKAQPQNNGAWICQNSWGDYSGDDGLFYISYEDGTLFNKDFGPTWCIKSTHNISEYETLYNDNEDAGPFTAYTPYSNKPKIYYFNKFDFGKNEVLDDIGFQTYTQGESYKAYYAPDKSGKPDLDSMHLLKSGNVDYAGYVKIDLDTDLNNKFIVPEGTGFIGIALSAKSGYQKGIGTTVNIPGMYEHSEYKVGTSYAALYGNGYNQTNEISSSRKAIFFIKPMTTKNYVIGDVSEDDLIDVTDISMIQQYLARIINFTPEQEKQALVADYKTEGVSINHATAMQLYLAKINVKTKIGTLVKK